VAGLSSWVLVIIVVVVVMVVAVVVMVVAVDVVVMVIAVDVVAVVVAVVVIAVVVAVVVAGFFGGRGMNYKLDSSRANVFSSAKAASFCSKSAHDLFNPRANIYGPL
jgi:hypothetical protein